MTGYEQRQYERYLAEGYSPREARDLAFEDRHELDWPDEEAFQR